MGEGIVEPGDGVDLNNPMGMLKSGLSLDFNGLSLVRGESSLLQKEHCPLYAKHIIM